MVSANTGATITSSGYSAWVRATDVTPATWNGGTTFSLNGDGNYRIETRVEWWNSSAQTAWIADRTTRYRLIDSYQRDRGVFGSCSYVA